MNPAPRDHAVGHLLRELAPQVLGALARRHGDFAAAEDAVQDALVTAATRWPVDGIPTNPRGWLYRVAGRRMTDQQRSEIARRRREDVVASEMPTAEAPAAIPGGEGGLDEDDTLVLLFMCCHPALTPASAIALTLRAVGGLGTAEIATAFLVPEATMAQRISRAKQSIRASGVAFALPSERERGERLAAVLHVLYLIFNEGYTSSGGASLQRSAIASAMVEGPRAGLELLDALDTDARLRGHHRLDAVRGHLFELAGDHERALAHYRAAAERTASIPERDYLEMRAARLGQRGASERT